MTDHECYFWLQFHQPPRGSRVSHTASVGFHRAGCGTRPEGTRQDKRERWARPRVTPRTPPRPGSWERGWVSCRTPGCAALRHVALLKRPGAWWTPVAQPHTGLPRRATATRTWCSAVWPEVRRASAGRCRRWLRRVPPDWARRPEMARRAFRLDSDSQRRECRPAGREHPGRRRHRKALLET